MLEILVRFKNVPRNSTSEKNNNNNWSPSSFPSSFHKYGSLSIKKVKGLDNNCATLRTGKEDFSKTF